ncbi:MAG: hypothetical protein U1E76_05560 [Planctomycetota bacterium]
MKKLALTFAAAVAALGFVAENSVAAGRNPGSLLVYPIFDSTAGVATVITVTNTNSDFSYNQQTGLAKGTVDVEYRYIEGSTCKEFNRTERLTPNDTLSVIASAHNAQQSLGYLYVYAKNPQTQAPMSWNWLIGAELAVNGIYSFDYGVNPITYKAIPAEGANTDIDGDGVRDLDNVEYEASPAVIKVPRFFGQGAFVSNLVLINLTGGSQFYATIDFLIYNDNEQKFSAEYQFRCWSRVLLSSISGAFNEAFLDTTANDPDEIVGVPAIETGWFEMNGGVASSTSRTIDDPAFLALLVETVGGFGSGDLPFEVGTQTNGDLLPRNVNGDNN